MYLREGYKIYVSKKKDKKYDVYDKNDKFITSFGSKNMEHYKDLLGYYSFLNHYDEKRRDAFKKRFNKLINTNNKMSGIYWSNKYLW